MKFNRERMENINKIVYFRNKKKYISHISQKLNVSHHFLCAVVVVGFFYYEIDNRRKTPKIRLLCQTIEFVQKFNFNKNKIDKHF